MEQNKYDSELDEMRQQIALLKSKLDKEAIINDKLLRDTMKQKVSRINKNAIIVYICGLFVLTFGSCVFYMITQSVPFVVATIIMMIFCIGLTAHIHHGYSPDDVSGDMLTLARKTKKLKKQYKDWRKVSYVLIIIWFAYLAYVLCQNNTQAITFIISAAIGAAIGGIIGFKLDKKVIDTCDAILAELEINE